MSVPNRRKKRTRNERSALQVAEESFHLLRSLDLRYFWIFYLGVIPFGVALLYFTADMSRSSLTDSTVFGSSLVMVAAYFWMRICQAKFSKGLWDTISPSREETRSLTVRFQQTVALCFFQAFQVPLLLVGLFFLIPLGWIVAALQNASVLAYTQNSDGRELRRLLGNSFRHSHVDWAQNHGVLLIFCLVGILTWINLIATAAIVPTLAKSFFGIESVFTISPTAAILNSTFFLGTLILTYLILSPMLKAVYTLRCFYAESRVTGADLLSRLAVWEEKRKGDKGSNQEVLSRASAIVIALFVLVAPAQAQESAGESASETVGAVVEVDQNQLQKQITETLGQKKYQWQLSQRELDAEEYKEKSWLSRRSREIADSFREAMKSFSDWMKKQWEQMRGDRERKIRPSNDGTGSNFSEGISSTLSIGLIILVSGLVAWLVLLMYRKYRGKPPVEGEAASVEVVDLQSEDIMASQLPEDEWMKLAREQIKKGDRRLAVRALFLASLAHLGEVGLLRIARFKSNRMYRDELARKARKHEKLRSAFETNIQLFEKAWYGWHPVSEKTIEEFLVHHRTIGEESSKVPGSQSDSTTLPEPQPA